MQQLDFDTNAHWQDAWKEQDPTLQKRINIDQLRQVFLSLGKDISASMLFSYLIAIDIKSIYLPTLDRQ